VSILYVNANVYAPTVPFATALLVQNGVVAWIGDASGAEVHREIAETVIDCCGNFLSPAFVDAHVHATSTGLLLDGLNLSEVKSSLEMLELLSEFARHRRGDIILGHGWDETSWDDPQLPSRNDIDRATWGSEVYLSRIDVHSALVSSAIVEYVPGVRDLAGFADFAVSAEAHAVLRTHALSRLTGSQRLRAQRAFGQHSLSQGIASVHEMAGPSISSVADAQSLKELCDLGVGPEVFLYWGQLAQEGGLDIARDLGAVGAGGDLFVDGAIGSRTAALSQDYSDQQGNSGLNYLTSEQVAEHVVSCHQADLQAGFHAIGDRGIGIALTGIGVASSKLKDSQIRRARHRLEHAELVSEKQLSLIREFNLTASMQPLFDELWGHKGGMYESRLGERSLSMNRWGSMLAQGTTVCFSSDSPVTVMSPWKAIYAATHHNNSLERISMRAAFNAHTRAGWRALGAHYDNCGAIEVGAPAHLALWRVEDYSVHVPDPRVSQWSTDPRSATVPLPDLSRDSLPECLLTSVRGDVRFVSETFDGMSL
jgi:predicted amidohydrolase YtcJ